MPFLSKAGSLIRLTANKQIRSELSPLSLSVHQAIKCTSSVASQEALRGSSYQTDEQTLRKAFAKSGEVVDAKTVMDRDAGIPRGLGFVASTAMQALNGQHLHSPRVRMNSATDMLHSNFGGVLGYGGLVGGYGLRSYGSGASDKILSTSNSSIHGVGESVKSTIGVGQSNSFSSGATVSTGGGYKIAYSSSDATSAEQGVNTLRPLSPHLPVYTPQTNSTFSILDRISACYLTAMLFGYLLVCLKMSAICFTFEPFYKFIFYSANLVPLSLELGVLATLYHTYCGLCHVAANLKGYRLFRFLRK